MAEIMISTLLIYLSIGACIGLWLVGYWYRDEIASGISLKHTLIGCALLWAAFIFMWPVMIVLAILCNWVFNDDMSYLDDNEQGWM